MNATIRAIAVSVMQVLTDTMSDVLIYRTENARIPNSEQCTTRVQPTFNMVQAAMLTTI